MFCGEHTLIGAGSRDVHLNVLFCKRWSCDVCMPSRLAQLRRLAADGEPTTFLTFTAKPSRYEHEAEAARDLVHCWRMVRQHLIREGYCDTLPFIAVIEEHRSGWPHLHLLARMPYVPQKHLSALADRYIGAPVVDIRRVYNRRHASRYIAKYCAKGPALYAGCKRYWRSQDYADLYASDTPVADRGRHWWRERMHISDVIWNLQNCDWHHINDAITHVELAPGPNASWLWWDHPPPSKVRRPSCDYRH